MLLVVLQHESCDSNRLYQRSDREGFIRKCTNEEKYFINFLVGPCDNVICERVTCPDGKSAPIPEGECCPNLNFCPDPCDAITCTNVYCFDGSLAPIPGGACCPDINYCPTTTTGNI